MSDQLKGIILMALGCLSIPAVDSFAKVLSADFSPVFVSFLRYLTAAAIVTPFAFAVSGKKIIPAKNRLIPHIMRTVFIIGAMTSYYVAISTIELATAVACFFIGPIIATILSAFILKERLTWIKIVSLVVGFAGALVVARPSGAVEPGILFALLTGLLFGFYLVATRMASGETPPLQSLTFQNLFGAALLVVPGILFFSMPSSDHLLLIFAMGLGSCISHALSITAFRYADASTLSPIVYAELVGAVLFGYVFFGEVPSTSVWIGAALIVSAGFLVMFSSSKSAVSKNLTVLKQDQP
ncbi:DMT family transporter [Rhizobium sp. L1K21]|uniref:DMT family transporter n=1 Tax=Rhizobium sp. L1K21 TaxID=2954933 RepID=UPI0020927B74|nr:DMT family transporter [Rhizobium sp. L1K21]MCO6184900.1 DMT family transporter [Rhizobium sp. L1K21]